MLNKRIINVMYKKCVKRLLFLTITLWSFAAFGDKIIKVAVIDTGLKQLYRPSANLCNTGHKDFTGEGLEDRHGHGTNIIGLIVNNAGSKNYCIIVIKAFASDRKYYYNQALHYAHDINADIINLSGGGAGFDMIEEQAVKRLLDKNVTLIVSAGNHKQDLDKDCYFYPACYDPRIFVIGSSTTRSSNYGSVVDIKEDGDHQTAFGETFSGTSQATAIFTGKVLREAELIRKNGAAWDR